MLLLTLQVSGFTLSSWQVCVEYSYDILKATVELLTTWTECQAVCCFNFIYTETVKQMLWFWYTDKIRSDGNTLTCIQEVLSLNLSQDINYHDTGIPCFPSGPGEGQDDTNKAKTSSFHIIANSCLTNHPTI
jgi:hypothetical protein